MYRARVIPCLLLRGNGLVKTINFKNGIYIGDPINTVKIFNEKEVDEIIILDIEATTRVKEPNFKLVSDIASECFMPLCYGGGIRSIDDIRTILNLGVEKVSINSYAIENPYFIKMASEKFGSQSIIVSIDVKRNLFGRYEIYIANGTKNTKLDPLRFALQMEEMGAGEILLNSIDRDGTMKGYDIELIQMVSKETGIPVIACGGAGKIEDFGRAINAGGASAVAAGSLFVFNGKHRAVLISFPTTDELNMLSQ